MVKARGRRGSFSEGNPRFLIKKQKEEHSKGNNRKSTEDLEMNGRWDVTLAHRGEKQKERRTKVVLVTVRRHVVASWVGADSPFSAFFSRLPHDFTSFTHELGYISLYAT